MKKITQEWLDYAKADLQACKKMISDDLLTNIVAFHTQQLVEKCFKAILEEKNLKIPRIHSLIRLFDIIEKIIDFELDLKILNIIDRVYIKSRYPGDLGLLPDGKPTLEQTKQLYEFAKDIYSKTVKMLK